MCDTRVSPAQSSMSLLRASVRLIQSMLMEELSQGPHVPLYFLCAIMVVSRFACLLALGCPNLSSEYSSCTHLPCLPCLHLAWLFLLLGSFAECSLTGPFRTRASGSVCLLKLCASRAKACLWASDKHQTSTLLPCPLAPAEHPHKLKQCQRREGSFHPMRS